VRVLIILSLMKHDDDDTLYYVEKVKDYFVPGVMCARPVMLSVRVVES